MIKITVEGDTVQDVAKNLLAMAKQFQTTAAPEDAVSSAPKAPAAPKAPKAPKNDAAEPAQEAKQISYTEDVAPKVLKLAETKGRAAAVAVLEKFGVQKGPQLTADQYPGIIKALDAALAE